MWRWLTEYTYTWRFLIRVLLKTAVLFAIFNVLFALLNPLNFLGEFTLYNTVVPGRERLPYGENASQSYNLSLNNLNAMFASHVISQEKAEDEYRVILMGDSSTWGFLLKPEDTLAGKINAGDYRTKDGKRVRAYNLGYPIMSLTKDLLLLDEAMRYEPDMVIWLITLESFPRDKQLFPPLVQQNPEPVRELIRRYKLQLDPDDDRFVEVDFWERTIIGQRRPLAELILFQVYGLAWAATGIDQHYPETYQLRQSDFEEDLSWHMLTEPQPLEGGYLVFDVLQAGIERIGSTRFLLVNEPMFISEGRNSDLRYNFFYPRWVYDAYRAQLTALAESRNWPFLDLWDRIDPAEFTDSPVHLTPAGSQQLSEWIGAAIVN